MRRLSNQSQQLHVIEQVKSRKNSPSLNQYTLNDVLDLRQVKLNLSQLIISSRLEQFTQLHSRLSTLH